MVGIYVATINGFMMGPFFEKGMSMKCGQTPCQKYWPTLTKIIEEGMCLLSACPHGGFLERLQIAFLADASHEQRKA